MSNSGDTSTVIEGGASHRGDALHGGLREQMSHRVIRLGNMDGRLRLIVGTAVAWLIVAAVLMALRNTTSPSLGAGTVGGENVTVPVAVVVVSSLLSVTAWTFLLSGAFHTRRFIRVIVFGFFAWSVVSERDLANDSGVAAPLGIALLAALVVVGGLTLRSDLRAGHSDDVTHWRPLRLVMVGVPVFGLFLLGWLSAQTAGYPEDYANDLADQLDTLTVVLIPLLVLAGADFGDWAHFTAERLVGALRARSAWLTCGIAALVAAGMLADSIRVAADNFSYEAIPALILLGVLVVLMLAARPHGAWHSHLAFSALACVAIIDSLIATVIFNASANDPNVNDIALGVSALFWAGVGAVALLALLVGRRRLPNLVVVALVFFVLVGATDVLGALPSIGITVPRLGVDPATAPFLQLEAVRGVAAAATLLVVVGTLVTQRVRQAARPIGLLLILLAGLQILSWVDLLFEKVSGAEQLSVVAGVVLVIALLWELIASGEAVTNRHDRWAPRPGRVLLYLGYILLVASSVLFFATLHTETGAPHEPLFDSEQFVHEGVLFLGLPLVLALFVAGAGTWFTSAGRRGAVTAEGATGPSGG